MVKLYAHKVNADLAKIINTCWKEHDMFIHENGFLQKEAHVEREGYKGGNFGSMI